MERRTFLKLVTTLGVDGIMVAGLGSRFLARFGAAGPLDVRDAWAGPVPPPGSASYILPAWFDGHRVQGHTRLSLRDLKRPVFFKAGEGFKAMGAHVFCRHIKSGGEGAWWPSAVGAIAPEAKGRNLAKMIIDEAHANGLAIIVYSRHMEDDSLADQHPEWLCRNWRSRPLASTRGQQLCFNSPYPEYFLKRALELLALGADGFYFDYAHMPKVGCWCEYCRTGFKKETGLDLPPRADPRDPRWHRLIDFNNRTVERTFVRWREAIHARNPNAVMVVSSNTWTAMIDRHLTNRLFHQVDSTKAEFLHPVREFRRHSFFPLSEEARPFERDVKLALGYTLARDAADGRPAHVWVFALRDEASTLYATAGLVTHGCISNLDVWEDTIPNPMFAKAFALGDRVSPHFAGTIPLRWAALHYSEHARDRFLANPREAVRKVIYPLYGAYEALLRAHLPVGIITDCQLEEGLLDGYRVLFLPSPGNLTEKMSASVKRFAAQGGLVVEHSEGWKWHGPSPDYQRAAQAFLAKIGEELRRVPVRVAGGPETMHAVAFVSRARDRLVVSLANDFSWVEIGRRKKGVSIPRSISPAGPPPPCNGASIFIQGFAKPQSIVEAVSGQTLEVTSEAGALVIRVPRFEYMAVVAMRLGQ